MILTHKIQLQPTVSQEIYFEKACGVARYAYNWALERWSQQCRSGLTTNEAKN